MAVQSLVTASWSFTKFSNHSWIIEEIYHENQGGTDKCPWYHDSFRGSQNGSQFRESGSEGRYLILGIFMQLSVIIYMHLAYFLGLLDVLMSYKGCDYVMKYVVKVYMLEVG